MNVGRICSRVAASASSRRRSGTPRSEWPRTKWGRSSCSLVNEAIEEALRQRVKVAVIHEPELAETIDGLAAEYRFC
jgi:hypothetical protein